jgi:hypothetical protein
MLSTAAYSQTLRAIGQDLETQHVGAFDMESQGRDFLVRARPKLPHTDELRSQNIPENPSQETSQDLKGRSSEKNQNFTAALPSAVVELVYTLDDIDLLERNGRVKRRDPRGMPDLLSLSQILRAVGAYIDQRAGHLLSVSRYYDPSEAIESVIFHYETYTHERKEEVWKASNIYDLCVRMYKRRERQGVSESSDDVAS